MAVEYGEGGGLTVTMDGPFAGSGGTSGVKLTTINAPANAWKGGESPYSQTVAVDGVTVSSKIDVQLSADQVKLYANQIIAIQAVNSNGIVTLYAYGNKPESDIAIQATISEVLGEGDIFGNISTTTRTQSDYAQEDSTKADYINNKPDAAIKKAQDTADTAKATAEAALPKSGGSMTGTVDMGGNKVINVPNPEEGHHAANKDFVESYSDAKHKTFTADLTADGWQGDGPYTQTVAVSGILATDMPHYGVAYSADQETRLAQKEAFAMVDDLETADGSVTFTCFEDKPTVNIPIQMEVNR